MNEVLQWLCIASAVSIALVSFGVTWKAEEKREEEIEDIRLQTLKLASLMNKIIQILENEKKGRFK